MQQEPHGPGRNFGIPDYELAGLINTALSLRDTPLTLHAFLMDVAERYGLTIAQYVTANVGTAENAVTHVRVVGGRTFTVRD